MTKNFCTGKHDIRLWLDTFYFEADHRFSTSHDYKVAKIIANDLIQVYLEDRLNNVNVKKVSNNSLKWTANKTALTELIYALYSHGVFNNGNTDIKLIAKAFEDAFNIELGDFYHTFMELKARKINRTKFLDSLCETLIKKMDEQVPFSRYSLLNPRFSLCPNQSAPACSDIRLFPLLFVLLPYYFDFFLFLSGWGSAFTSCSFSTFRPVEWAYLRAFL